MVWPTIPSFSDSYGHAGIWCWIGRETVFVLGCGTFPYLSEVS